MVCRHQDVEADHLAAGLDARHDIHSIAHGGIVEARLRAHIADAGDAGVDADADADRSFLAEAERIAGIERNQRLRIARAARTALVPMIATSTGHSRTP